MGLPKGRTNNKEGRPPGAVNKLSKEMRENITDFLQDNWVDVVKEFKKLKGKDKLLFYRDLLPYVIPKLQAQAIELGFAFDTMNEETLELLCNKLIERENE